LGAGREHWSRDLNGGQSGPRIGSKDEIRRLGEGSRFREAGHGIYGLKEEKEKKKIRLEIKETTG